MRRILYLPRTISIVHRGTARPAISIATTAINSRAMSTEKTPTKQPDNASTEQDPGNGGSSQPLPLPEPPKDTEATKLDVSSGQGVKLDHLGPMVVNRDGTLSRIANWEHMTDIERNNTLRILGKRNQLRLSALRSEDEGGETLGEK